MIWGKDSENSESTASQQYVTNSEKLSKQGKTKRPPLPKKFLVPRNEAVRGGEAVGGTGRNVSGSQVMGVMGVGGAR